MTNSTIPAESFKPSADGPSFYRWEVPGKPLAVHLSLDLLDRLERDVIESFKAVTKRGSEIGGVLVGRVSPGATKTICIEKFEPVECEYSRGPLYLLADEDKQRLRQTLAKVKGAGLSAVGYFRSNTRRALSLDDDDLAVASEFFSDPLNVFLLVRPYAMKPSAGGFFFWEGGQIQGEETYLEFPFKRSALLKDFAQFIVAGEKTEEAARQPVVIPVREERPAAPPVVLKREEPRPAPPPPPVRQEPVPPPPVAKREEPAPVGFRREERPPVAPPPAKREERTPAPLSFRREERPPIVPVQPRREERPSGPTLVSKREEPAPPVVVKKEERPAPPPVAKREERPPQAPPRREEKPAITVRREEKPVVVTKREEPKVEEKPVEKPVEKPAAAARQPEATVTARKEEPAVKADLREELTPRKSSLGLESADSEPAQPGLFSRLKWVIIAIVLIGLAGGGYFAYRSMAPAQEAAKTDSTLALKVERSSGQLMLTWNRDAALIASASRATLTIIDGDHKEDVDLELNQLRQGSIVYSPMTNDVSFRLEVTDLKHGKSLGESVRVLAGRPSPTVAGNATPDPTSQAKPTDTAAKTPTPAATPAPVAQQPEQPRVVAGPAVTAAPPKPESLAARLRAAEPQELPAPPTLEGSGVSLPSGGAPVSSAPLAAAPAPARPAPQTPAAQPRTPARRPGGVATEAKLIKRVSPVYPTLARQTRATGIVRVQALIGKDGRVKRATALSGPPLLRQSASDAVMRWIYNPAMLNGEPTESETQVDVNFMM